MAIRLASGKFQVAGHKFQIPISKYQAPNSISNTHQVETVENVLCTKIKIHHFRGICHTYTSMIEIFAFSPANEASAK